MTWTTKIRHVSELFEKPDLCMSVFREGTRPSVADHANIGGCRIHLQIPPSQRGSAQLNLLTHFTTGHLARSERVTCISRNQYGNVAVWVDRYTAVHEDVEEILAYCHRHFGLRPLRNKAVTFNDEELHGHVGADTGMRVEVGDEVIEAYILYRGGN